MGSKTALDEKHSSTIMKELLKHNEPIYLSSLQKLIKNYYALQNTVLKLAEEGYIKIENTEYKGRPAKLVSLTPTGRAVAEQLRQAEIISKIPPEELEKYKRLHYLEHFNMYEDHVTLTDISMEGIHYVNIYARPRGNVLYFWCEEHDSDDCYHIGYMFFDSKLKEFIKSWINKNGYRLAKKYDKYVEKYW